MVFVCTAMGVLYVEHVNVLELCYIELLSGDGSPYSILSGNIFTPVFLVILFTGGCASSGGMCASSSRDAFSRRGVLPPAGVCFLKGVPGGDPPRDGYCCVQYASYWNAFLYFVLISHYSSFSKRIKDFSEERQHIINPNFPKNCMKMKNIERITERWRHPYFLTILS